MNPVRTTFNTSNHYVNESWDGHNVDLVTPKWPSQGQRSKTYDNLDRSLQILSSLDLKRPSAILEESQIPRSTPFPSRVEQQKEKIDEFQRQLDKEVSELLDILTMSARQTF